MPSFQSAQPARFIAGMTQDLDFMPLAGMGSPDPFFVALDDDDFLPYLSGGYTAGGTGSTPAAAAGAGGLFTMSLAATINNNGYIQRPAASMAIQNSALTNRLWYAGRFSLSQLTTTTLIAGLTNLGNPFSALTDGLYFSMAPGGVLSFVSNVTSTPTTYSLSGQFTPTANVAFDLAFMYSPFGSIGASISIWAGSNLFGNKSGAQNQALLGPMARVQPATLTTANLAMVQGISTNAATAAVLTSDFHMCALER